MKREDGTGCINSAIRGGIDGKRTRVSCSTRGIRPLYSYLILAGTGKYISRWDVVSNGKNVFVGFTVFIGFSVRSSKSKKKNGRP